MKKNLIVTLFAMALVCATPVVRAEFGTISGTVGSTGTALRYAFLTGKNLTKAVLSVPAMLVVYPYKAFKYHPKKSAAVTVAVLASLATLWYANPESFAVNPYVTDIMNGANQLTADVIQRTVDFLQYDCPEYAQWLRETVCNNCTVPTPAPCAPVDCIPVDCIPVDCTAVPCAPVECTPCSTVINMDCSKEACLEHLNFWNYF